MIEKIKELDKTSKPIKIVTTTFLIENTDMDDKSCEEICKSFDACIDDTDKLLVARITDYNYGSEKDNKDQTTFKVMK